MSETEHFSPNSAEPKTYGDGQFPESLDPPKADELPFSSDREGIEQAIENARDCRRAQCHRRDLISGW